jgi:hypothetical protein
VREFDEICEARQSNIWRGVPCGKAFVKATKLRRYNYDQESGYGKWEKIAPKEI